MFRWKSSKFLRQKNESKNSIFDMPVFPRMKIKIILHGSMNWSCNYLSFWRFWRLGTTNIFPLEKNLKNEVNNIEEDLALRLQLCSFYIIITRGNLIIYVYMLIISSNLYISTTTTINKSSSTIIHNSKHCYSSVWTSWY